MRAIDLNEFVEEFVFQIHIVELSSQEDVLTHLQQFLLLG